MSAENIEDMFENICILCKEHMLDSEETVTLKEKGVKGIQKAAENRDEIMSVKPGQKVHTLCRKNYTNQLLISLKRKQTCDTNEKVNLRSETSFSFKDDCLFCTKSIKETNRHKNYPEYYPV